MLGEVLYRFIESQILINDFYCDNEQPEYEAIRINHNIPICFNKFRDVDIECLVFHNNVGGQIKFNKLDRETVSFFKKEAEKLGLKYKENINQIIYYIKEFCDERKLMDFLCKMYEIDKLVSVREH